MVFYCSRALRAAGVWLGVFVAGSMFAIGTKVEPGPQAWPFAGIGLGLMLEAVALRRGRIDCDPDGIHVRNLFLDYFFPWVSVAEVVAQDRVVVIARGGARYRLWAVQKSNLAIVLNRRSVVEEVAEQIETYRKIAADGEREDGHAAAFRQVAWLTPLEFTAVVLLGLGPFLLGMAV